LAGAVLHYPIDPTPWSLVHQLEHRQPISTALNGSSSVVEAVGRWGWTPYELQRWAARQDFVVLVVDEQADHGQARTLARLVGGSPALVDGPDWSGSMLAPHDLATQKVRPLTSEVPVVPEGWTGRDPVLLPLLDPTQDPGNSVLLQAYTRTETGGWLARGAPFARGMTTLGLSVVRDGQGRDEALLLSGLADLGPALSTIAPADHPATILVFTTTDLQTWGIRRYELDAQAAVIDPQVDWVDGGPRLTAWAIDRLGVDPALLAGDHAIFQARLGPRGRFGPLQERLVAPGLADPATLDDLLFATRLDLDTTIRSQVVMARCGDTGACTVEYRFPEMSVPFAWREGSTLHLLMHAPKVAGGHYVVETQSTDGGRSWSEPERSQGLPEATACESPVAIRFRNETILFCSVRP
jgi:hypothetical protein